MAERLGLIAGGGRFPLLVARNARAQGVEVAVAALRDNASPEIEAHVDTVKWVSVTQLGRIIRFLRAQRVTEVILAGSVRKTVIYSPAKLLLHPPDARALKMWYQHLKDHKDATIISMFIRELAQEGIEVVSSIKYLPDCLAPEGALSERAPDEREMADIEFGGRIAAALADLDVGQSIMVKDRVVVAVEAVEGTDETIRRGGALAGKGAVLVKFSRTNQDLRFDIPTVGADTVAVCRESGVSAIAVEAGGTLVVDMDEMAAAADEAGIAVCGIAREPASR